MSSWMGLKVLVLIVYGYYVFLFCRTMLGAKLRSKYITAAVIILYEILIDYLLLGVLIKVDYFLAVTLSQLGLTLIIFFLYKGSPGKKLAFATILYVIQELSAYAVVPLLTRCADLLVFNVWGGNALPDGLDYLIGLLRYGVICLLLAQIIRRCPTLSEDIPKEMTAVLLVPSLFIVLVLEFVAFACNEKQLFQILYYLQEEQMPVIVYQLADVVILFILSALGLWANCVILFSSERAMRQVLQRQQLKLQVGYYQTMERQYRELRGIRHDLKNHILSLSSLLRERRIAEAREYLQQLSDQGDLTEGKIRTGNQVADAILDAKYQEAMLWGIDFQCNLKLPEGHRINDFDLCIILGNAVDNALEACRAIETPGRHKYVYIQSAIINRYFVLEVKNSMGQQSVITQSLKSTKQTRQWHGIGLANLEAAVEKYQGVMELTAESYTFCLSIMFPITAH